MASKIDEVDLALLDAVHVNPRIGFDELGTVLGLSGVTIARRWRRLVDEGNAWVSSAIGPALPMVGALLQAESVPGMTQKVADSWAALPQAFSVHITTGRLNVYALIVAQDEARLSRLVVDTMPSIPGLRAVQSSMMFRLFSGTHWRLGALSTGQARSVSVGPQTCTPRALDDVDQQLYLALQHDGRLSYRQLASQLECSETQARRRLLALTRSGSLRFRADFARAEAGWPVNVVLELAVPAQLSVASVGSELVGWPETRVVAALIGERAQLLVTVQVHRLDALEAVTSRLLASAPGLSVESTRVVLRPVKSFGRLLDTDGRACGMVPVDPWAAAPLGD